MDLVRCIGMSPLVGTIGALISRLVSGSIVDSCVVNLTMTATVVAQSTPGELSAAHARFEGIKNCTLCHTLGKNVANDNCLSCHTELGARISSQVGFHARLQQKRCIECHKEHHGRMFSLVRFDTKSFNHSSVGYVLEGKHRLIECARCHRKENIKAKDVLRNTAMIDRKSTRLNSSHSRASRMPSSA